MTALSTGYSASRRPRLTVIAVWHADSSLLSEWLAGIARLDGSEDLEIIVVGTGLSATGIAGAEDVKVIEAAAGQSLHALRRAGMEVATGDIILFTRDGDADFGERLARLVHDVAGKYDEPPDHGGPRLKSR
jgi:hypothetical protein